MVWEWRDICRWWNSCTPVILALFVAEALEVLLTKPAQTVPTVLHCRGREWMPIKKTALSWMVLSFGCCYSCNYQDTRIALCSLCALMAESPWCRRCITWHRKHSQAILFTYVYGLAELHINDDCQDVDCGRFGYRKIIKCQLLVTKALLWSLSDTCAYLLYLTTVQVLLHSGLDNFTCIRVANVKNCTEAICSGKV